MKIDVLNSRSRLSPGAFDGFVFNNFEEVFSRYVLVEKYTEKQRQFDVDNAIFYQKLLKMLNPHNF